MCGLCGVLGAEDHWTDASARRRAFRGRQTPDGRSACTHRARQPRPPPLRPEARRLQGQSYVLRSATGRAELVPHLAGMWSARREARRAPVRSPRRRADRRPGAGLSMAAYETLIPGQRDHRVSRQRQDHAPQPAAALAAARALAVLVNEFGEVGLDHLLLETLDAETVILQSGCVCCTIRAISRMRSASCSAGASESDPALRSPRDRDHRLADPAPIISTLLAEPVIRHHFRLGNVIVTVDAINGPCTSPRTRNRSSRWRSPIASS